MTAVRDEDRECSAPSKSLVELASEHQERWAADYIASHKIRRWTSWIVALALSPLEFLAIYQNCTRVWDESTWDSILMAAFWPCSVLASVSFATRFNQLGRFATGTWLISWALSIFHCSIVSWPLFEFKLAILAILHIIATTTTICTLAFGLRIPGAPHIQWDLVEADYILNVSSARGGYFYPRVISTFEDAEKVAASWLRRFGHKDAKATRKGKDNGIDVVAMRAVAQVKWWKTKNVGIVDVQRLVGAANPGQACYFFASRGYTREARTWARGSDHQVALFLLDDSGNVTAANYHAKRHFGMHRFGCRVATKSLNLDPSLHLRYSLHWQ